MGSKIYFLGTAGDVYVSSRQTLKTGGIILEIDGMQFHLDPGPGALTQLNNIGLNPRATTAIFVSHNHLNHCNDVEAIIQAMTYAGEDSHGVLVSNQSFLQENLNNHFKNLVEKAISLSAGNRVGIGNIEVTALETQHSDQTAIGFKFVTPYFILSYTGDTGYFKGMEKQYRDSDIIILNVPLPSNTKSTNNLNREDAIKIIKAVQPRLAIITHFGSQMLKSDPLYESREIQKQTGVQIITAKDGMKISPDSYAAKSPQKRLNTFPTEQDERSFEKVETSKSNVRITEVQQMLDEIEEDDQANTSNNEPEENT